MSALPLPPTDGFIHCLDDLPSTHECRRCRVQWRQDERLPARCWMCGLPGDRLIHPNLVVGMSVAFGAH